MRIIVTALISLSLLLTSQLKADTTTVYFAYKVKDIDEGAQQKITALANSGIIKPGLKITILGYSDYVGGPEYNLHLSQERANSVKSALIKTGVKKGNIKVCIGKGKIERPGETDSR